MLCFAYFSTDLFFEQKKDFCAKKITFSVFGKKHEKQKRKQHQVQ
jgi:hypothetical protein